MSFLSRISRLASSYQQTLNRLFRDPFSPEFALAGAHLPLPNHTENHDKNSLLEKSIFWNTPKRRKTIERRSIAKYGMKEWGNLKLLTKNKKIRVDHKTGEFFEFGRLAPETYYKIMAETKEIQKKMAEAFFLKPKDKEVVVSYKGEQQLNEDGKHVIEMEKPRPQIFSSNLMQKTKVSQDSSSATTVRPSGLG